MSAALLQQAFPSPACESVIIFGTMTRVKEHAVYEPASLGPAKLLHDMHSADLVLLWPQPSTKLAYVLYVCYHAVNDIGMLVLQIVH